MLRTVTRLTPTFIPFFQARHENDYDFINTRTSKQPETGWERVKMMYARNEHDEFSVELHTVIQSAMSGAFLGAGFGGFVRSRNAYVYFIENNQATIFKSTMQAKKKLQDYVTVAFAKGAVQWGWRLGFFTGLFSTLATTISVYRGDTSLIEYVAAGTITGALYKVNLGLAATMVGAGLGCVLSTVAGMAILGILKLTGVSMDDIRRALHKIKEAREEQMHQAMEKSCEIKNDAITKHHQAILDERGEKKIEEIM
ncbi:RPII140-upstream gene protein [Pectinophora gossypiella]|uniref:RPII140-upstream gene protein n=1 Tax=Pectinophora gossypiella TaxID=13191 RepID=UPI00214E87AA|nr:RPII140-upstream gene protein [Pectinophora gossypiella]